MAEILNAAAALASIISAVVAAVSAIKARRRKSEVETYRNELLARQDLGEIGRLRGKAEHLCGEYQSHTSNPERLIRRGGSYQEEGVKLQSFVNEAEDVASRFERKARQSATRDLKELRQVGEAMAGLESRDPAKPLLGRAYQHLDRIRIAFGRALESRLT